MVLDANGSLKNNQELGLWCLTQPLSTIVQLYRDGCTNNIETYTVNFKQLFYLFSSFYFQLGEIYTSFL
jgi:ferric iron reductase protein FhuF